MKPKMQLTNAYPISEGNEFQINEFLSLRLEDDETMIYVDGRPFRHCKFLQLDISVDKMTEIRDLTSIDEISDALDHSMEPTFLNQREPSKPEIDPEVEFWGHCSNLQVWYENEYNSNLLHSNLAFPLLKELTDAGDPLARRVFKEEIAKRLNSEYIPVVVYLILQGYIMYLSPDEIGSLEFFKKVEGYARQKGDGKINDRNMMEGLTHYIMNLKPKSPSEWVSKGIFSRVLRNPHLTIRIFEDGLEQYPDSEILITNYMAELHLQKRWGKGIPYYERMVKKRPENADVWNIYGTLHMRSGKHEKAVKHFKKAIKLDPEYIIPKLNLIRTFDNLGYRKVINDMLDKILAMEIRDEKTLEMIAQTCHEVDNIDYEIKIIKKMIFLNPERSILWYGLSELYFQKGKPHHQRRCLKKVIYLDNDPPIVGNALNSMAVIAMERNDLHNALELLLRAVKKNPDNDSAWANLGLTLAVKFQMNRGDLAMKIADLLRKKKALTATPKQTYQVKRTNPFSGEALRLTQKITRMISEFESMKFECFACKKTFSNVSKFCPFCGFKLGLSKEDMDKNLDKRKLEEIRRKDPMLSKLPRFPPETILNNLSHRSWMSFSNLLIKLEAKTRKEIEEVGRTVQILIVERKVIRENANGVLLLKKVNSDKGLFF